MEFASGNAKVTQLNQSGISGINDADCIKMASDLHSRKAFFSPTEY